MIAYLAWMPVKHMVLNYKGRQVIDNWTSINYLHFVQSRWGLGIPSMLRATQPYSLGGRGTICPSSRTAGGYHTPSENSNWLFTHSLDVE